MPDRISLNVRMDPAALVQLDALAARFFLSRTAAIHLAIARLAQAEGVDGGPGRPAPTPGALGEEERS